MDGDTQEISGLGLTEAIESIRNDLVAAMASGANAQIQLPVSSLTVELQVIATSGLDGRAGFKVPFLNLELGGAASRQRERTSTVTVVFDEPVDRDGNPVKVSGLTMHPKG